MITFDVAKRTAPTAPVDKLPNLGLIRTSGVIALVAALYLPIALVGYLWLERGPIRQYRSAQASLVSVARLDEASTLAARLAAETGNSTWAIRFNQSSDSLNSSVTEVARLLQEDKDARKLRDTLSTHLGLEKRALRQLRQGDRQEALDLLTSESAAAAEDSFIRTYTRLSSRLEKDSEILAGVLRLMAWGESEPGLLLFC
ncbi:MAG: hypothetical protein QM758_21600 [Armatimonas sp.]